MDRRQGRGIALVLDASSAVSSSRVRCIRTFQAPHIHLPYRHAFTKNRFTVVKLGPIHNIIGIRIRLLVGFGFQVRSRKFSDISFWIKVFRQQLKKWKKRKSQDLSDRLRANLRNSLPFGFCTLLSGGHYLLCLTLFFCLQGVRKKVLRGSRGANLPTGGICL